MPIAELPSGFKGGTFSPKNNSDPSPPSNWIVIIVMVSEVEPVLKYNTKRNNPKQTKQKNRNSGVPAFLVANYTSLREARRLLLNIFSPIVSCCRHGFQRRVELHCRVSNTFISHETSLSQHVAEEESDQSTMNGHNISKPRTTCFHSSLSSPVAHFYIIFLNQKFWPGPAGLCATSTGERPIIQSSKWTNRE